MLKYFAENVVKFPQQLVMKGPHTEYHASPWKNVITSVHGTLQIWPINIFWERQSSIKFTNSTLIIFIAFKVYGGGVLGKEGGEGNKRKANPPHSHHKIGLNKNQDMVRQSLFLYLWASKCCTGYNLTGIRLLHNDLEARCTKHENSLYMWG